MEGLEGGAEGEEREGDVVEKGDLLCSLSLLYGEVCRLSGLEERRKERKKELQTFPGFF